MSSLAHKRMSLDEFLSWDDGTQTRFELIDGVPVAMAPSYGAHQIVAGNIARHIGNALDKRPPCHVRSEAGILKPTASATSSRPTLPSPARRTGMGSTTRPTRW
ncbi:hypothetical protein [Azospirillum largimobile]